MDGALPGVESEDPFEIWNKIFQVSHVTCTWPTKDEALKNVFYFPHDRQRRYERGGGYFTRDVVVASNGVAVWREKNDFSLNVQINWKEQTWLLVFPSFSELIFSRFDFSLMIFIPLRLPLIVWFIGIF